MPGRSFLFVDGSNLFFKGYRSKTSGKEKEVDVKFMAVNKNQIVKAVK